jgi:hypothetical protein
MDSSANVLLTLVRGNEMRKIAVKLANGLEKFPDYEYYAEPEVSKQWKDYVPDMDEGFIIVGLDHIFDSYSYIMD